LNRVWEEALTAFGGPPKPPTIPNRRTDEQRPHDPTAHRNDHRRRARRPGLPHLHRRLGSWWPAEYHIGQALRDGITGGGGWTSLLELFAKAATDQR
jgi:hypothetical protein